jgi:hypothetical protein
LTPDLYGEFHDGTKLVVITDFMSERTGLLVGNPNNMKKIDFKSNSSGARSGGCGQYFM